MPVAASRRKQGKDMPEWRVAIWEWLEASDPGWSRLRVAGSGAAAMATALGVELVFAILMGVGPKGRLIAMVLGAVVAMLGAMALTATGGSARTKARTAIFFPFAVGIGMLLGVAVGGRTDVMLSVFVVVMFLAVFVRRFGPDFFFYGFLFWLGYFFASFLNAKLAMMPFFIEAVALGSAWVLLLSLTVFRVNPTRTLKHTVRAFDARARGVLRACAELLQSAGQGDSRVRRRLRQRIAGQERRLAEAALMVEGWAAEPAALPSRRAAAALRRQLIAAQQALDALIATTQELAEAGDAFCVDAGRIAWRLAHRADAGAERQARELQKISRSGTPGRRDTGSDPARRSAYRFAGATLIFVSQARAARHLHLGNDTPEEHGTAEFEPTAGLVMGNLPGSAAVARGLPARGARWNPLARLDLTSRQAIQVAVAGGIAIVAGRALSPARYYWAVIAAFIMFSGTATRSETFLKGFNRVIGTALGLTVAVGLAELTVGHPTAIVATIVVSVFCGFYLIRVGYVYTIFFITIMVAQLYTVFHEFTPGLLVLRLEETAIGAAVGFAVALLLMPLSTRDTVRRARREMLEALAKLLNAAADRLACSSSGEAAAADVGPDRERQKPVGLYALSRAFDDRIRRFVLVTTPLTRPLLGGGNFVAARHRLNRYVAVGTSARALVVALDELGSVNPSRNLSDAASSLAQVAARLAESRAGRSGSAAAESLAQAETTLSEFDPTAIARYEHLTQSLRRLHYLLKSLSAPP
jgi:hypothetical protein